MRHKTIETLIDRARRLYAKDQKNEKSTMGYEPTYAYACTKNKWGDPVWAIEIMDGTINLQHYGASLLSYDSLDGLEDWTTNKNKMGRPLHPNISVSDQQGMNGFVNHLGIDYYTYRAGRTADYGGIA